MKELKFIHITKCAGTFIENIGKENNINWGRFHKEYGFWHKIFINQNEKLKNKYDWFVIVRNPYTRILSEYYCEWGGICKKNIKHNKKEFNDYLIKKIKERDLKGHHYTEQYKYIDFNSKIYIIKFENLNKELIELFKKYNLNISIENNKKINTKKNKNKKIKFTIKDFNKELINLINKIYHNDFLLFNYKKINI